jgi:hypothetical protein
MASSTLLYFSTFLRFLVKGTLVGKRYWTQKVCFDFLCNFFFLVTVRRYNVIKKSLCTRWLKYRKLQAMFKVSPASLKTFIDTRLTLTQSVFPNYNYVIMVSDLNCLKHFYVFFCTVIIRFREIFWSPCIWYILTTTRLLFSFPMPPRVLYGLRGLPSHLWPKCNRLLWLGRPWGAVTLSRRGGRWYMNMKHQNGP